MFLKNKIILIICILIGVVLIGATLTLIIGKNQKDMNQNIDEFSEIDKANPIIILGDSYVIKTGSEINLVDAIFSADDIDNNPKREIIGVYDISTPGEYNLTYKIEDKSGNIETKDFVLKVQDEINEDSSYKEEEITFEEAVKRYKNDETFIGIDISKWQEEIDWKKVSESGSEFAIIRFGYQNGFDGEILEDPYLEQNINGCRQNNIPVAFYFSSYAKTKEESIEHALWAINVLKKYNYEKASIAFDWENWKSFNKLGISLNDINNIANGFMEEFEKNGYHPFLYGSKTYLEKVWTNKNNYDIWLANYIDKTEYEGKYKIWQFTQKGKINGIKGNVDINVMIGTK